MSIRKAVLAVAATSGIVLGLVSVAWACTDFTRIDTITPLSGRAAAAAVNGSGAAAGSMVELRWNTLDGPVIARAQADGTGAFSVDAAIPDVPAGIYTVIAGDGKSSVGRVPYEVGPVPASGAAGAPVSPRDLAYDAKTSPGFGPPSANLMSGATLVLFMAALLGLASVALVTLGCRRALIPR